MGLAGGDCAAGRHVIVAVPHGRAARPAARRRAPRPRRLARGSARSPIVNLHVVYDRPVLELPFAAGVDSPVQWVFDRTASAGLTDGQYLVVSLSAADAELGVSASELRERYLAALAELLPAAAGATVRNCFVTREHAATFRAAPGQRALRPGPPTALPGLVLAGAWTDTGWPATMEGAVRSGHAASERIIRRLSGPTRTAAAPRRPLAAASRGGAARRAQPRRASPRRARPARCAGEPPTRPPPPTRPLMVLAPLALEARAVRRGAPWADVRRTGMGPSAPPSTRAAHDHRTPPRS